MLRMLALAALAAGAFAAGGETPPTREDEIAFTSSDGVKLVGVILRPDEAAPGAGAAARRPLVALLHSLHRDRDGLGPLADALATRGFACLLLDLRGHGRSTRREGIGVYSFAVEPLKDLHRVVDDHRAALAALAERPDIDVDRIALVGVGHGALIAAEAAARWAEAKALVLVDPTTPVAGFGPARDLGLFGPRPVLLVTSAYPYSRDRAAALTRFGGGERRVFSSEFFEQTDRLLDAGVPAIDEIVRWLADRLPPPAPPAPP